MIKNILTHLDDWTEGQKPAIRFLIALVFFSIFWSLVAWAGYVFWTTQLTYIAGE